MKLFYDKTYISDCKNKINYFNIGDNIVDNYIEHITNDNDIDILYEYIKISDDRYKQIGYRQ